MTGLYATIAIQAALRQRDATGRGQAIDMALFDVMTGVLANQAMNYLVSGRVPHRLGNAHPNIAPYEAFAAADGPFVLAVGSDAQFARAMAVLDIADAAGDARFRTNADRVAHRAELAALIGERCRTWPRAALLDALAAAGVPAGPVNTLAEAFADPQILHRAMAVPLQRDDGVRVPAVRLPIRMSGADLSPTTPAPRLGE